MLAIFGGLFALLFWLIARQVSGANIKGWTKASLVISPLGLALVQGDMKGEMHWDELESLKSASQWTVSNAHTRLDQGNAPWEDYAASAVSITRAMKAFK